jgi:hypothetical protein
MLYQLVSPSESAERKYTVLDVKKWNTSRKGQGEKIMR